MRLRFAAALGVAALVTVSCGGVTSPSNNRIENFSGTLQSPNNASAYFEFSASNTGEYSIVIKALSPASSVVLGIVYGVPQGNMTCGGFQTNIGSLNSVVLSGQIVKGSYCIQVYDYFGTITTPETYTVAVSHP
jgi:hypothetical protein